MNINTDIKAYSQPMTVGEGGTVTGAEGKKQYEVTDADVNEVGKNTTTESGKSGQTTGMDVPNNRSDKSNGAGKASSLINWDEGNFIPSDLLLKLFEANKKMRAANLDARNTELNMQVSSLMGQVKDIKDAAAKTYTASLIQGWVSIGSGITSGISSAVGIAKSYGAGKDLKDMKTLTQNRNELSKYSEDASFTSKLSSDFKTAVGEADGRLTILGRQIEQSANVTQSANAAGTAIGSVGGGVGSVASAGQTKEASELEAEGKKKEAEATRIAAELQKTNEYAQNAKEQLKATLDLIQAIANAEKSVTDTVVKNMV